jgi:3-oxoacyl-[acyl-carrier-protein] synthase-3
LTPTDIDFLSMYQGTPWLRDVVQDYAGLHRARSVDVFARTGYISSALVPANLRFALDEGGLKDDELVVMTGGGTGMTYGALVMRWGA